MVRIGGDVSRSADQRVVEMLRESIFSGEWRPGATLPPERELAARFDVDIEIVERSVQQLVYEGLVERRRGADAVVRKHSYDQSLFRFFRFQGTDGERSVPESRILRRERIAAPDHIATSLKLPPGSEAVAVTRLRLLDDEPVMVEEIWLPAGTFGTLPDIDAKLIGPLLYPLYEDLFGEIVVRADEVVTVESASPEHAELLEIDAGSPVIVVDRLAFGYDDEPIEWRCSRGRTDRVQYHAEIR